jgi:hypothetical protein
LSLSRPRLLTPRGAFKLLASTIALVLVLAHLAFAGEISAGTDGGGKSSGCGPESTCKYNVNIGSPRHVEIAPGTDASHVYRKDSAGWITIAPPAYAYTADNGNEGIKYKARVNFRIDGVTYLGQNWVLDLRGPNQGIVSTYQVGQDQFREIPLGPTDGINLWLRYIGGTAVNGQQVKSIHSRMQVEWLMIDDWLPNFDLTAGDKLLIRADRIPDRAYNPGFVALGADADEGGGQTTLSIAPSDNSEVKSSAINGSTFAGDGGGSIQIKNGEQTITGSATDAGHNVTSQSLTVRFDSGVPTVVLLQTPVYNTPSPVIPVQVTDKPINGYSSNVDPKTIHLNLDDGSGMRQVDAAVTSTGPGMYNVQPHDLAQGLYVFSIDASDGVGNLGKSSDDNAQPMAIDWSAPVIDQLSPAEGQTYGIDAPPDSIGGVVTDNVAIKSTELKFDNVTLPTDPIDPTAPPKVLPVTGTPEGLQCPGSHTATLTATDFKDNLVTKSWSYKITGKLAPHSDAAKDCRRIACNSAKKWIKQLTKSASDARRDQRTKQRQLKRYNRLAKRGPKAGRAPFKAKADELSAALRVLKSQIKKYNKDLHKARSLRSHSCR